MREHPSCLPPLIQLPELLLSHPRIEELRAAVDRVVSHPALACPDEPTTANVVRAALLATVCFYRNLNACVHHELQRAHERSPFYVESDGRLLHLLLALAAGELAAKNMPDAVHHEPHYCGMLRAASAAGVETEAVEELVCGRKSLTHSGLSPAAMEYLHMSAECCKTFIDSFATIAIRELTLSSSFHRILTGLPPDKRYAPFRGFLEAHIELDEEAHAGFMKEALEVLGNTEQVIGTMIAFYHRRAEMYDACLETRALF